MGALDVNCDIPALTAENARDLTDRIKVAVEGTWLLIKDAYEMRAWAALGYGSWDDYCTREFGTARLRLPREERREVVASLRESGLSIRAIAAATGNDYSTIQGDCQVIGNRSPGTVQADCQVIQKGSAGTSHDDEEAVTVMVLPSPEPEPEAKPAAITGTDGKTYPVKRPAPQPDKSVEAVQARQRRVREMADSGYTALQIAKELNIGEEGVRQIARRLRISIHADEVMGRPRRHDHTRILDETVTMLEGVASGLAVIDVSQVDHGSMDRWVTSLTVSLRSLTRFTKQLRDAAQ